MAFWQLLTLVGTMATILGVSLAVYALINNRTLKTEERLTREEMRTESRLTREEMKTEASLTREMIAKMEEGLKETIKEIARKTDEIARLIVAEGERTRREIKT